MLKLLICTIKNRFRNRMALFFSLVFPVIFVTIFSLFNFEAAGNLNIIVVDKANNEVTKNISDVFKKMENFGYREEQNLDQAKTIIEKGEDLEFEVYKKKENSSGFEAIKEEHRPSLIIYFPEEMKDIPSAMVDKNKMLPIKLYYDNTEQSQISPIAIVEGILKDITQKTSLSLFHFQGRNMFQIEQKELSVKKIKYFDFLVPGIIGMGIMQSSIIGIASSISSYREKNILKRLLTTPLPISRFLAAEVISFILLSLLQTTVLLVLSTKFLGATIYGSIPLIYLLTIIGNISFLNLGFIAASIAKNTHSATALSNIFTMPMMFLSGVFFDRETLPIIIRHIANILPLSPLLDALREVAINEATLSDISTEIFMLLGFGIVTFIIAAKIFKLTLKD